MAGHRRVHSDKVVSSKPCFLFAKGKCKFGRTCKYSHEAASSRPFRPRSQTTSSQTPDRRPPNSGVRKGKFQGWKALIAQGLSAAYATQASAVAEIFQTGLELLDGGIGAAQDVIKLLVTDDGLRFIRVTIDHHIPLASTSAAKSSLWSRQLYPIFRFVTHPRVIDSAVLEQEVATLFTFILGVGGIRMKNLFDFVTSVIHDPHAAWPEGNSKMEAAELSLAVLTKILDVNSISNISDGIRLIVERLAATVQGDNSSDSETEFAQLQATKYLDYVKRRLAVGDNIPLRQAGVDVPLVRDSFILRHDLPGKLSSGGARHDNDHEDITSITIMPTKGEILSPRAEYLPTNDSTQWHKQGIQGRLDREFRLLREDTVGQLRDTIRDKFEEIRNQQSGEAHHHGKNNLRSFTYDSPLLMNVDFDKKEGLELVVQFRQPKELRTATQQKRRDWWLHGKRLQEGALVCVLDSTGSVIYFEVSAQTLRTSQDSKKVGWGKRVADRHAQDDGANNDKDIRTLSDDRDFGYVSLRLVDTTDHNIGQTIRWFRPAGVFIRRYLVEFPGILLASFKYTLQALQEMYRTPDVPFSHLIAPTQSQDEVEVRPPLYSSKPGFAFNLKSITKDGHGLTVSPRKPRKNDVGLIKSHTTLDPTQSQAFLDTLNRELSLIQGPPGTGKSYSGENIIKAIIANKKPGDLGAVLCVCYTNHALDQLLEHLLDQGIDKLIRMGSRSKSERLEEFNLRTVSQGVGRTRTENRNLYDLKSKIDENDREIKTLIDRLCGAESWQTIKNWLKVRYPHHHDAMFGNDEAGWTTVHHKPESAIKQWMNHNSESDRPSRSSDELVQCPLSGMTSAERRKLHNLWLREIRDPIVKEMITVCRHYNRSKEWQDRIYSDVRLRCLQGVDVVGVTTTGLARNIHLLRKLHCKVLVCEEAGEVLEAHILTALLPSIEHAILIGDHLQLRPQTQNHSLQSTNPRGKSYSLDMSLFERLVQPPHAHDISLPFSSLETQRRMHPSIANLVRSTLYPRLVDGENVRNYPEVVGLKRRLFWLHHEELEAAASSLDANSTSHWNAFEVEMTVALVSHLVRQGVYGPDDIAVITPYLGQLFKLRRRMESMFEVCLNERDEEDLELFEAEGKDVAPTSKPSPVAKTTLLKSVRVATVDNFQGDEAKVVVVSLVRSNPQNKCGFLSTPNRINVLLSRAKHGMYLLGNADTYGGVPMWSKVLGLLQEKGNFGTSLELQCPRHIDAPPMLVSRPDHFVQFSPESGCQLPCEKRLGCGHRCHGRCHSDILHAASKCLEPCPRLKKGCEHACPRLCSDPCHARCITVLNGTAITLPCGHMLQSPQCWQAQDPSAVQCKALVDRTMPGCAHVMRVRCSENTEDDNFKCTAYCAFIRPCGHACMSPCHRCRERKEGKVVVENHGICESLCGRNYSSCQHVCRKKCHEGTKCGACKAPCDIRCSHSRCSKSCSEPCSPCAEGVCNSHCQHSRCTMPCAAPCDWIPCSKRCDKVLDCGHQCPSLCGEICPPSKFCQQCGPDEVKSAVVDFLEMKEYHEIDLDEDACIFPTCGHFLTTASMDGQMDMAAHYNFDVLGSISSIKASTEPFSMDEVKVCATCRGSLRSIARYGRIVRRAMLDEATKKFTTWSNGEYAALAEQLLDEQDKLEASAEADPKTQSQAATTTTALGTSKSRIVQLQTIVKNAKDRRYNGLFALRKKIHSYAGRVRKEEQPFQRVKELVQYANQQNADRAKAGFSFDESVIQTKGSLLSGLLLLKCEMAILGDFLRKAELKPDLSRTELNLSIHLADCRELIRLARETHHPCQEAEGHLYYAQLCHFCRAASASVKDQPKDAPAESGDLADQTAGKEAELEAWKTDGLAHIDQATALVDKYSSAENLRSQVEAVELMLRDGIFYRSVTTDEMRAVYRAMAGEFSGTGHWYKCEQGHPFTIGECGMPMEEARCPECNSPIGGHDHEAVDGVRYANEIEQLDGGVADRLQIF